MTEAEPHCKEMESAEHIGVNRQISIKTVIFFTITTVVATLYSISLIPIDISRRFYSDPLGKYILVWRVLYILPIASSSIASIVSLVYLRQRRRRQRFGVCSTVCACRTPSWHSSKRIAASPTNKTQPIEARNIPTTDYPAEAVRKVKKAMRPFLWLILLFSPFGFGVMVVFMFLVLRQRIDSCFSGDALLTDNVRVFFSREYVYSGAVCPWNGTEWQGNATLTQLCQEAMTCSFSPILMQLIIRQRLMMQIVASCVASANGTLAVTASSRTMLLLLIGQVSLVFGVALIFEVSISTFETHYIVKEIISTSLGCIIVFLFVTKAGYMTSSLMVLMNLRQKQYEEQRIMAIRAERRIIRRSVEQKTAFLAEVALGIREPLLQVYNSIGRALEQAMSHKVAKDKQNTDENHVNRAFLGPLAEGLSSEFKELHETIDDFVDLSFLASAMDPFTNASHNSTKGPTASKHWQKVTLKGIVSRELQRCYAGFESREVTVALSPSLEGFVRLDVLKVSRLLREFVSNALVHGRRGPVRVTLSAGGEGSVNTSRGKENSQKRRDSLRERRGLIHLIVEDEGDGMPREALEDLWHQSTESRSKHRNGASSENSARKHRVFSKATLDNVNLESPSYLLWRSCPALSYLDIRQKSELSVEASIRERSAALKHRSCLPDIDHIFSSHMRETEPLQHVSSSASSATRIAASENKWGAPSPRVRAGLGLGLPACKYISQSLGGDLAIRSTMGHGTTVACSFAFMSEQRQPPHGILPYQNVSLAQQGLFCYPQQRQDSEKVILLSERASFRRFMRQNWSSKLSILSSTTCQTCNLFMERLGKSVGEMIELEELVNEELHESSDCPFRDPEVVLLLDVKTPYFSNSLSDVNRAFSGGMDCESTAANESISKKIILSTMLSSLSSALEAGFSSVKTVERASTAFHGRRMVDGLHCPSLMCLNVGEELQALFEDLVVNERERHRNNARILYFRAPLFLFHVIDAAKNRRRYPLGISLFDELSLGIGGSVGGCKRRSSAPQPLLALQNDRFPQHKPRNEGAAGLPSTSLAGASAVPASSLCREPRRKNREEQLPSRRTVGDAASIRGEGSTSEKRLRSWADMEEQDSLPFRLFKNGTELNKRVFG